MKATPSRLAGLTLLVAAVPVLALRYVPQDITIEPPSRVTATRSVVPDGLPELISDLNIDLAIDQNAIRAAIDTFVPRSFSGTEDDPLAAANNDKLTWSLAIGAAEVSAVDDAFGFRIPLENGLVNITGRVGVANSTKRGPLAWVQKALGFNFDKTVEFDGVISGALRPRLNEDWTIEPGLSMNVSLSEAEAKLFGQALKISLRSAIKERIEAEISEQEERLRDRLASDGRVATAVENVWNKMHAVVKVSSDPPVWAHWKPVELAASPVSMSDGQVSVTFGTRVNAAILMSSERPTVDVTELPPPASLSGGEGIKMRVPVSMRLDQIASLLPAELDLAERLDHADGTLIFRSLSIQQASESLTVAADVTVDTGWWPAKDMTLYVTGTPHLDPVSNRLSLADAQFDSGTRSALEEAAEFVLEADVLRAIEQRSVFEILESEQELLTRARIELGIIEEVLPAWVHADLNIDRGYVSSVFSSDGWLVAVLELSGHIGLQVRNIESLLASAQP